MISKYRMDWPDGVTPLQIEMHCIQRGGKWQLDGKTVGEGLEYHYEQMRKIIWPELDDHRWHKVCLNAQINHKLTVFIGPGSSGKTHEAGWLRLCEYWCFPQETVVLVSSTDMRGLRLRIWAEISDLWQKGVERFPELNGYM